MHELAFNKAIRDTLAALAELNPEVGPIDLCSAWFDDFYFPGHSIPEGHPPDAWDKGQRDWKECFNDGELRILTEFHNVFASEVDGLPTAGPWQEDAHWQTVRDAARAPVDQLEGLSNNSE